MFPDDNCPRPLACVRTGGESESIPSRETVIFFNRFHLQDWKPYVQGVREGEREREKERDRERERYREIDRDREREEEGARDQ